jgi:hypothetical protein
MRIATWNLDFRDGLSDERARAFVEQMGQIEADVWILTETWASLAPGPEYEWTAASCWASDLANGKDRRQADRRWVAIWSRLPARVLEVRSEPERMACVRVEQAGWPDMVVVGTVLPWLLDGGSVAFLRSLDAQATEWGRLWGSPRSCACCVAGDFNQPLEGSQQGFSHERRASLEASLSRLQMKCVTRDLRGQDGHSDRTIDHICLGGVHTPLIARHAEKWAAPRLGAGDALITDHDGYYVDLCPAQEA